MNKKKFCKCESCMLHRATLVDKEYEESGMA